MADSIDATWGAMTPIDPQSRQAQVRFTAADGDVLLRLDEQELVTARDAMTEALVTLTEAPLANFRLARWHGITRYVESVGGAGLSFEVGGGIIHLLMPLRQLELLHGVTGDCLKRRQTSSAQSHSDKSSGNPQREGTTPGSDVSIAPLTSAARTEDGD